MLHNVFGLGEVGDFEAQKLDKLQKPIEAVKLKSVLPPPFWQTLVSGSTVNFIGFVAKK